MRASSSCSGLIVVVLALVGGCSPAGDTPVVVASAETPAPLQLDELLHEVENVRPLSNTGRDRYIDYVSNPAAAVWQELPRPGTR
jgi:hypothetical protein